MDYKTNMETEMEMEMEMDMDMDMDRSLYYYKSLIIQSHSIM